MGNRKSYIILSCFIASVWFVNGLFCKILKFVPRHEEIVLRIIGSHSSEITVLIGILEIAMAAWIISGYKSRLNCRIQIIVVASMNLLEFFLAPDLLLWGRFNILFASAFIAIVYWREFVLKKQIDGYAVT